MTKYKSEYKESNSKQAIYGMYKDNQTFCFITSDNPMGIKSSPEENNKKRENMENDLKVVHRHYTKFKGRYNDEDTSFLIINITLTECLWLASKYKQQSFIFGKKENGKMIYHYYETSDGKKYKDKEQSDVISNQSDAEKFFKHITCINRFKFKIGFKLESIESMQKSFYEIYSWNPKFEENFKEYMEEGKTIKHYYFHNHFCMETKQHFVNRMEELISLKPEYIDEDDVRLYYNINDCQHKVYH